MKYLNVFVCLGILSFLFSGCQIETKVAKENKLPVYKGVFTSVPRLVPTNKTPDGPIIGNGDVGMVFGGTPDSQCFYLSKTDVWKAKDGYPNGGVCYIGTLCITSEVLKGASYFAEQEIGKARVNAEFVKGGYDYRMQSWVSATDNIAVIEIAGGEEPVPVRLALSTSEESDSQNENGVTDGVYWSVRKFNTTDLEFPTEVAVAMKLIGADKPDFEVGKSHKVSVVLGFCTNHDDTEYLQKAILKVKEQSSAKLAAIQQAHEKWWSDFWQESSVCLGDSVLEKYYYGSQYLLACCSRNPSFPPGLWGTSLTMDATANGWGGDYHLNYNHQAPWWGAYSSNHIALTEPYDAPILEYVDKAKEHAKVFLGKKGVYYPVGIGPKGFCTSMFPLTKEDMLRQYGTPETGIEGGYMFLGQKSNAVFCTTNMFMRFYHTYDRQYAKKVYPFIREVADFWEDYLVYENNRYVSYDDNFWEVGPWEGKEFRKNYGDINPTISLGLCRMLFKGVIEMSNFLGVDQDRVEKWNHILTHLSEIPTVEVDGVTHIKACEGGTGSGSRTIPGFGRVMMHGLVFPSGVCGVLTDPAFAALLCDEIYRWEVDTVKYSGWKDASWDNLGNGFETYYTAAARLGYDGNKLLNQLKMRIEKTAFPNLWIEQSGGGIETLSAVPSCINEMLLQGYEGTVRVFPVWPKEKEASFTDLRTHGAFLVSSSCKAGEVISVRIVSEKGRVCRIENPWNGKCKVVRRGHDGEVLDVGIFELDTSPGEIIELYPSE